MGAGAIAGVISLMCAGGCRLFLCEFGAREASKAVVFLFRVVGGVVVEGWFGVLAGAHCED